MNEDLICPYCGAVQETHEPDQISADMCWTQCEKCGMMKQCSRFRPIPLEENKEGGQ